MQFLFPEFLWALLLLVIPIIIHLFQFRFFKKVYFPNVRFLEKIQQESKSRNKIKKWLLLFTRMLFIAALVFAFAQPFLPGDRPGQQDTGDNAVSVYVDNSFSMTNEGTDGMLMEKGRETSRQIAESYLPSDRFLLLTNNFGERYHRFTNQRQFIEWTNDIEETSYNPRLSNVIERKLDLFYEQDHSAGQAFFISDFQRTFADLDNIEIDSGITYNFIPLEAETTTNVYIDSIWLESPVLQPGQSNIINARIVNDGRDSRSGPVNLHLNNQSQAIGNYDLEGGESVIEELTFTVRQDGWNTGRISIEDHPVIFDDTYYFSFKVEENAQIKIINAQEQNHYLNALFTTDDFFEVTNTAPGDVSFDEIAAQNFIVLNEVQSLSSGLLSELVTFVEEGGNLLIIPSRNHGTYTEESAELYRQFGLGQISGINETEQSATQLNFESPIFTGVFQDIPDQLTLPEVQRNYMLTSTPYSEALIQLRDGTPLIDHYTREQGNVFVSSVPLITEWTNLPEQGIFVPLFYRIALFEHNAPQIAYSLGEERSLTFSAKDLGRDEVFQIKRMDEGEEIIPEQSVERNRLTIEIDDEIREAGIYELSPTQTEPTSGNSFKVALNYDRNESVMDFISNEELESFARDKNINVIDGATADIEGEIRTLQQGAHLWYYFVILALLFSLAEIAIFKLL